MPKILLTAVAAIAAGFGAYALSRSHTSQKEQTVTTSNTPQASPLQRAGSPDPSLTNPDAPGVDPDKFDWSKVDWRKRLTPEEFHIMREAGTERAFTGEYWNTFNEGQYNCRACGLPLFKSDAKFDSHCGWPSFDEAVNKDAIVEIPDDTIGHRVEVRCRRCGAHLGHIFDDGPTATGMRYCINSPSIKFEPKDKEKDDAKSEEPAKKP